MCKSTPAKSSPSVEGQHVLSPHLEGIHKISIVMSGGAVTVVVAGILLYCLIKWRVIKCCDRSNSSNNNYGNNNHQQPSAPPQPQHVVTMTSPTAPVQGVTQPELEMSLLKLQNQVMLQQLNAQGNQPQQAKAGGDGRGDINQLLALGLNRYPVV